MRARHQDPAGEHRTYWVVFGESGVAGAGRPWWYCFCREGWRHCFVIADSANSQGVMTSSVVNPLAHSVQIRSYLCAGSTLAAEASELGFVVLKVETATPTGYIQRGLISCVTVVKAVTGIRAPLVQTPRMLFKHLQRLGAEQLD